MRVLFSPIGTADPLTILGDGPMLHIVRHYQPSKVFLFLTPDMAKYEKKDKRNKRAIELLSKELGIETPDITYEYSNQVEAHRYDFYIEEFSNILTQLDNEYSDAEIIVNASSGTPAMEQALVAFDAFDQLGLRAIQVSTPANGMNSKGDREDPNDYDLENLWDLNPDKGSGRANRCIEVESVHFKDLLLRDNVRALVCDYDYAAALYLAGLSKTFPSDAKKLIEGCVARMELDNTKAAKLFGGTDFAFDPAKRLQEYLWVLEVYLERQQWADYLRAMTPALFETLHKFVRDKLNIPDDSWLKCSENRDTQFYEYRLDTDKICANDRLCKALDGHTIHGNPFVSNGYFAQLVAGFAPQGDENVKLLMSLRKLEEGARHPLAHTTCKAEKNSIEKAGGMKLSESLQALFKLNNVEPGLYQHINEAIVNLL